MLAARKQAELLGNACLVSLNPLQAIYVYQKAAILSMMSEEELQETGEDIVGLFRSVSFR